MPKRDPKLLFEDILESAEKIERYTHGLSFEGFEGNDLVIDAVIRNFEIIGEASKNIPENLRRKHNELPWKRMIGFRNTAIHKYFEVDLETLWIVIKERLPEIKPIIQQIIKILESK
ncbi:MAG: HepT-like ribonuclease domain-containing protein [Thermodesulfobacteriota bacterium]